MYAEHFGFTRPPFDTTADPRVFYANAGYREAYATVLYGVREHKGIVLLTGEVGTGKTTVLRRAVAELEPAVRCALFSSPTPGFADVLALVCEELHLSGGEASSVAQLRRLRAWLEAEAAEDRTAAVLVDEAQNLDDLALEQLRLLSNLETPTRKLLQIVLVGQPELETTLDRHQLRQLRQRVALRCRLERLTTEGEVAAFVEYRLTAAGYRGRALFPPDVLALVARYSTGLPRLINILCDNALLATFAAGTTRVAAETIHEVARDLRLMPAPAAAEPARATPAVSAEPPHPQRRPAPRPPRVAWIAGGLALGLGGAGIGALVAGIDPGNLPRVEDVVRSVRRLADRPVAGPPPATAEAIVESTIPTPATGAQPALAQALAPRGEATSHPIGEGASHPAATRATDASRPGGRAVRIVIPRGATVAALVHEHYASDRLLAMDLVQELNAGIADVDLIRAGERIWLPPLGEDILVRRQRDGRFRLIVATLRDDADARRLRRVLEAQGYTTAVTRRPLSRTLAVSRVEIVALPDRRAAARAADTLRRLAVVTLPTTKESRE
jgi:type II secretory pathway predicted ATPase ExeA